MHVEKQRLDVVMELQEIYIQVSVFMFQTVIGQKKRIPFVRHDLCKKKY